MNRVVAILLVLSSATISRGQTKSDEDAVRALPRAFCEAWAKHDGHQLATIMAKDVDFVTVGGAWFHGRADFEKYHTKLLAGRFRDSTNTPLETVARFLSPDEAVVHWSWTIEGDKNPDGSPREKRFGIMTMLAKKQHDRWLVVVAQNTNAGPGAPEADDIKLPIRLPKAKPKP